MDIYQRLKKLQSIHGFHLLNLNEDLCAFLTNENQSSGKDKSGQVFTPPWIADYMSNLAIKSVDQVGIEPFFGTRVLLRSIF
ncbi:MAG: hypothetical protein VCF25_22080 [Candidatus Poribacteria bacterium]